MDIHDFHDGVLLVAADLQGNWEDYQMVRERFATLRARGSVDKLVLAGDVIHRYDGGRDASKEILDDLIDTPDPAVTVLMGNHELMHVYHLDMERNEFRFVEALEERIESDRARYINFLMGLPYAVRTAGGVTINHTGANPPMAGIVGNSRYAHLVEGQDCLRVAQRIHHAEVLREVTRLTRTARELRQGHSLTPDFFDDFTPQIGEQFLRTDVGMYLNDIFFNRNEGEYGNAYPEMLSRFLSTMGAELPQRLLVSGHNEVPRGYEVVADKQLRISSSYGADPGKKVLLRVDAAKPYAGVGELLGGIIPLSR